MISTPNDGEMHLFDYDWFSAQTDIQQKGMHLDAAKWSYHSGFTSK